MQAFNKDRQPCVLVMFLAALLAVALPVQASSIIELIGGDPSLFPNAPHPSIFFDRTITGQCDNPETTTDPTCTAQVEATARDSSGFTMNYAITYLLAEASRNITVEGVCADGSGATSPINMIGTVQERQLPATSISPTFVVPYNRHVTTLVTGMFCGSEQSGKAEFFELTSRSKGRDVDTATGHTVALDDTLSLRRNLSLQAEVIIKGAAGTVVFETTICQPVFDSSSGPLDICNGVEACRGTVTDTGGNIAFDVTCQSLPVTFP